MPTITLLSSTMPNLLPMQGRSEGLHISSIIHSLCVALGHYDGDREMNQAQLEVGNAIEHAIIDRFTLHYPGKFDKPGELEKDGMFGTPDLLNLETWADHEIKCTWMSSKHGPQSQKFWRYERQVMAYCWMLETLIGHLDVVFINGDYRDSGPQRMEWRYDFSEGELAENWEMLKRHGAEMVKKG